MKTISVNLFNRHHFKMPEVKKTNFLFSKVILLLLFAVYSMPLFAQVDNSSGNHSQILEVKSFITDLQNSGQNSNAQHLESLLYDIQSSVYFYDGTANTYGEKPSNLFTNIQSLNNLKNAAILKSNIEIVTLRIENATDLNSSIDLSAFASFQNLKYVYILSETNTTPNAINAMVLNNLKNYSVFYSIQVGDHNNQ
jgi:hypothetical protein